MFTGAAVVLAWGGGLAWIADAAASRGRSQIAWIALAILLSVVCFPLGWLLTLTLPVKALDAGSDVAVPVLTLLVPAGLTFFALLGLGLWLKRRPVKIKTARRWPVTCRINGAGKLEILPQVVRLVWQDRIQDIPRDQVSSIRRDGECLRVTWNEGELTLIPMLHPQTRDGRIEQSEVLARLLSPALPPAVQINRPRP